MKNHIIPIPYFVNSCIIYDIYIITGYFYFYERIKLQLVERRRKRFQVYPNESLNLSHLENFLAACLSGSIMVLITNPLWLIKTRMQLQLKRTQQAMLKQIIPYKKGIIHAPYKNMIDAASTILKEEGPLALYKVRVLVFSVLSIIISSYHHIPDILCYFLNHFDIFEGTIPALLLTSHGGIQFVVYEFLKRTFQSVELSESSKIQNRESSVIERLRNSFSFLIMGGTSKVVASTATFPLQTIKARIQQRTQGVELINGDNVALIKRTEYKGVLDCIQGIWKKEGIHGFFKGCATNAVRVAPSSAVTFVVYESLMDFFQHLEHIDQR